MTICETLESVIEEVKTSEKYCLERFLLGSNVMKGLIMELNVISNFNITSIKQYRGIKVEPYISKLSHNEHDNVFQYEITLKTFKLISKEQAEMRELLSKQSDTERWFSIDEFKRLRELRKKYLMSINVSNWFESARIPSKLEIENGHKILKNKNE